MIRRRREGGTGAKMIEEPIAGSFAVEIMERPIKPLTRITFDHKVMGGKPYIRGTRVTVVMIVGMIASGHSNEKILKLYPC